MKTKNLLFNLCLSLLGSACIGTTNSNLAGVIITDNQISGRVLDSSGSVVKLFNAKDPLASIQTIELPHGGEFKFNQLDSGTYQVQVIQTNGLQGYVSANVHFSNPDSTPSTGQNQSQSDSQTLGSIKAQNFVSIPIRLNDPTAKVYAYGKEIQNQNGLVQLPFLPLSQERFVQVVQNGQTQTLDLAYIANQLTLDNNIASVNRSDYSSIFDIGQNTTYHTLRIGTREWLLEPVSYQSSVISGKCYNGTNSCSGEGLFFESASTIPVPSFAGTIQICPSGYEIPTVEDINELASSLGSKAQAALALRSQNWLGKNASDPFGFNWTPSGWFNAKGIAEFKGSLGAFWLSSVDSAGKQLIAYIDNSSDSIQIIPAELHGARAQVRCIRNNNTPMAP